MKRMMRGLGVVGLAYAGVLLEAAPAAACGETPCAEQSETLPIDMSQPVPLNAELRIEYKGFVEPEEAGIDCSIPIAQMRLAAVGGEPHDIPAEMQRDRGDYPSTWMVAKPTTLEPNTEYIVTSLHAGDGQCSCEEPDYVEVMRFVTGEQRDERPPVAPEPFGSSETIAAISNNTCGRFHNFSASIDLEAPEDASPYARYNVYADGEVVRRYVEAGDTQVTINCVEDLERPGHFVAETQELEVRAVDIAGNEAQEGAKLTVFDSCDTAIAPPVEGSDASVDAAPDAGVASQDRDAGIIVEGDDDDDKKRDDGDSDGCSASGAAGSGWTFAFIALALVLARRSRKR